MKIKSTVKWEINKAGSTANTNCGRVGRGGNTRFHTFQLDHHDQRTDGRTDKAFYRVACPQLKTKKKKKKTKLQRKIARTIKQTDAKTHNNKTIIWPE